MTLDKAAGMQVCVNMGQSQCLQVPQHHKQLQKAWVERKFVEQCAWVQILKLVAVHLWQHCQTTKCNSMDTLHRWSWKEPHNMRNIWLNICILAFTERINVFWKNSCSDEDGYLVIFMKTFNSCNRCWKICWWHDKYTDKEDFPDSDQRDPSCFNYRLPIFSSGSPLSEEESWRGLLNINLW